LSNLLIYKEKTGDFQAIEIIKKNFPIAWQHVNLCGRYEFSKNLKDINIEAIVQELSKIQVKPNSTK
jgi:hypothetical protein